MSPFFKGFSEVFASFARIGWGVYAVIAAFCVLFLVAGFWLGSWAFDLMHFFISGLLAEVAADWLPDFLSGAAAWLSGVMVWVCVTLLMCVVSGSVILLILSPLLSHVADKAWVAEGNPEPHDSATDVLKSILRGIWVAIRCLILQIFCLVLLFVLSFVPVIGIIAPLLSFIVSAFFYGQSMIDYAVERAENQGAIQPKRSGDFPFNNLGLTIGLGLPFALAMLIPFVGRFLALFLAPATVAAGGVIVGRAALKK